METVLSLLEEEAGEEEDRNCRQFVEEGEVMMVLCDHYVATERETNINKYIIIT